MLVLYSVDGKDVIQSTLVKGELEKKLSLSGLKTGIYFYKIRGGSYDENGKVVVY